MHMLVCENRYKDECFSIDSMYRSVNTPARLMPFFAPSEIEKYFKTLCIYNVGFLNVKTVFTYCNDPALPG
jgi:hypothetical protein